MNCNSNTVATMRSVATSTAIILLSIVLAASAEESVAVQRNLGKIWCARAGSAPPSVYKTAESGCERSQYRVVDTKFEDNGLRWSVERRPLLAIKFPEGMRHLGTASYNSSCSRSHNPSPRYPSSPSSPPPSSSQR